VWSTASHPGCFTPWNPLNTRLGGPQSQSGLFWKKKKLLFQPGYEVTRIKIEKKISVGKRLGRQSLEISVQIWEDNIKVDHKEIICEDGWLFGP